MHYLSWWSGIHRFYKHGKVLKKSGLSPFSKLTSLYDFPVDHLSKEDMKFAELAEVVLNDIWQLFGQQDVSVFLINQQLKIIAERHNPDLDEQYHFLRTGRVIDPSIFGELHPL